MPSEPSAASATPPAAVPVSRPRVGRNFTPLLPYAAVLALTLLVMTPVLQLWRLDWGAPWTYEGDGALHLMFTKAFVENGWYLSNPRLGAPAGMELYEFPAADTLPGLFIKALGLFTRNPALINNLFYLLTYPLASLLAFAVCRQLGLRPAAAALVGLLYAFLPYHFYRNVGHLYLSAYFVVPLGILVAWWVATGRLLADGAAVRGRRLLAAAALCALLSLAGVYYPFFCGVLLAVACLYALGARRDWRSFLLGGLLGVVLVGGLLACLSPTLRYLRAHPDHPPVSQRSPGEAEFYGLKIAQLVLPVDHHRLAALGAVKDRYNENAPLMNENTSAALGSVGAVGFLLLLGWLLFRPVAGRSMAPPAADALPPPFWREILDVFAVFNAALVLFGTVGGGASLFSLLVSPQVRSVNRISVCIAFVSLVALAACLDAWSRRWPATWPRRALGWAALGGLFALGIFDQTPRVYISHYLRIRRESRQDRAFFQRIEASLPPGAMVFQLPYLPFPENGGVNHLGDYTGFLGYVHTHGLRWSYGAIKGGPEDVWQSQTASLPMADCLRLLALRGFGGVLLERDGYADDGAAVEAELRKLLGPPSAERLRRLFFGLENYTRALRASMSPERWALEQERASHPLLPVFGHGFTSQEADAENVWRWGGNASELRIENSSALTRRVLLKMTVNTGRPEPAHLVMQAPPAARTWEVNGERQALEAELVVPPGGLAVRFTCDAPRIDAPADSRVLVWSLNNLKLQEEDTPAK